MDDITFYSLYQYIYSKRDRKRKFRYYFLLQLLHFLTKTDNTMAL